ncbi:hypothetical protein Mapa_013024 [Marchantia paleacea]|nr:hypothetical protein Mapa_013024 [Marchantia paleacea]
MSSRKMSRIDISVLLFSIVELARFGAIMASSIDCTYTSGGSIDAAEASFLAVEQSNNPNDCVQTSNEYCTVMWENVVYNTALEICGTPGWSMKCSEVGQHLQDVIKQCIDADGNVQGKYTIDSDHNLVVEALLI